MNTIHTYDLCSNTRTPTSGEEHILSARALLFGRMVRLAQPHITAYQSDLYHDVHWLDKYVNPESWLRGFTFFYGVRDSGTTIGTEYELVSLSNTHVWKITLFKRETTFTERWCVAITDLR